MRRNKYKPIQKVIGCGMTLGIVLVLWLIPCGNGSITWHPRIDLGIFLFVVWFIFFEGVMTNNGPWWRYRLLGKK